MALDIKHTKTYTPFDPKDYISYVGRELTEASTLEANASLDVLPNFVESNVQGYYEIDLAKPDSYVLFPGQRTAIYNLNSINKIRDSAFNYFVVTGPPAGDITPTVKIISNNDYVNVSNFEDFATEAIPYRQYVYRAIQISGINQPIEIFAMPQDDKFDVYYQIFTDKERVIELLTTNDTQYTGYSGAENQGRKLRELGFTKIIDGINFATLYPFTVNNDEFIVFAVDSGYSQSSKATFNSEIYVINKTYLNSVNIPIQFNLDTILNGSFDQFNATYYFGTYNQVTNSSSTISPSDNLDNNDTVSNNESPVELGDIYEL